MPKPTDLPRWANVSGDIVEPTEDKKDVGWIAGEKPPAQFWNWLQKNIYDWLSYFDEAKELTLYFPAAMGQVSGTLADQIYTGAHALPTNVGYTENDATFNFDIPLTPVLLPGDVITEITVYGAEGNAGGEVYTAKVVSVATTGGPTQISTTKTSGTTGAETSIGWTTSDTDFTPDGYTVGNNFLVLACSVASASGTDEVRLYGAKVVITRET